MTVELEDVLIAIDECYHDLSMGHVWGADEPPSEEEYEKWRDACAAHNRTVRAVERHVHRRFLNT